MSAGDSGDVAVEAIANTLPLGGAPYPRHQARAPQVSLIFDRPLQPLAGTVTARNVTVNAKSVDDLVLIGVTAGITPGTAAVVRRQCSVFQNKVGATLRDITMSDVSVLLQAIHCL